ncbi:MAG: MBL fold metallo-hydrolase [Muribaculum sp.]|nr:MBL fold metallo-hydrolase [Muribaculum sp.]
MGILSYVFHDCFIYSTSECNIVFDFWQRPLGWCVPGGFAGTSPLPGDALSKPLYVVVSHFHKDHYNKEIFTWSRIFKSVTYIISADVARHARHILNTDSLYNGPRPKEGSVIVMREGDEWTDDNIKVDAFGSTDIGNSYVVSVGGKSLLHAGDLNAWIWIDESTPKEVESATKAYLTRLKKIEEKFPSLDIAMFPVDSRIGTDYYRGARLLLKHIDVGIFVPMHFELGDNPEQICLRHRDAIDFESYADTDSSTLCVALTAPGDCIRF